ncbi:hypothetical protein HZS_3642 [Henneguya salminicola]|nr:hypothetical protein HZS_3642 [Henneguya salminicola]
MSYIFDHDSLTETLHEEGINIRYIGYMAHLCKAMEKSCFIFILFIMEMICRSVKHIFRYLLTKIEKTQTPCMIAYFINCFLGSNLKPKLLLPVGTKNKYSKAKQIKIDEVCSTYNIKRVALLRSFCKMTGVQIFCRDFDFELKKTNAVQPEDIIELFPIVKKFFTPISIEIRDKLNQFKNFMFNSSYSLFSELKQNIQCVVNYFNHVYGSLTLQNAHCHSYVAKLYSVSGCHKNSVLFQFKSTILYERILGVDHFHTIISYYNLSTYFKNYKNLHAAINLLNKVRYLLNICYGLKHPFVRDVERNLAAHYFDLGQFSISLSYAESIMKYLQKYEPYNIKDMAEIHQVMAAIHFNCSNFRIAMREEKKAYDLFNGFIDDKENQTLKSCKNLLELYLKSALRYENDFLKKTGTPSNNDAQSNKKNTISSE